MKTIIKSVALALAALFTLTTQSQSAVIFDNGSPNLGSGWYRYAEDPLRIADDFSLTKGDMLASVQFWGGHFYGPTPANDTFGLDIFSDNGGTPGSLVASSALTVASRVDTGIDFNGNGPDILEYVADVANPFWLNRNTTYWLSIYHDAVSESTFYIAPSASDSGIFNWSFDQGATWEVPQSIGHAFNISNTFSDGTGIPTPGAALLLGVGLFGFATARRQRLI
jgi:hypothetical protein